MDNFKAKFNLIFAEEKKSRFLRLACKNLDWHVNFLGYTPAWRIDPNLKIKPRDGGSDGRLFAGLGGLPRVGERIPVKLIVVGSHRKVGGSFGRAKELPNSRWPLSVLTACIPSRPAGDQYTGFLIGYKFQGGGAPQLQGGT